MYLLALKEYLNTKDEEECAHCIRDLNLDEGQMRVLLDDYINTSVDRQALSGLVDLLEFLLSTAQMLTKQDIHTAVMSFLEFYRDVETDAPWIPEHMGPFINHWLSNDVLSAAEDLVGLLTSDQFKRDPRPLRQLTSRAKLLGYILNDAANAGGNVWDDLRNQINLDGLLGPLFELPTSPWKSMDEYWADFKISREQW